MKRFVFLAILFFISTFSFSQIHGVKFQRCLGDLTFSKLYTTKPTADGGYITCGRARQNSGDVTGAIGNTMSGWIVKLTAQGGIQWQCCVNSQETDLRDIIQASDGSYLACGSTIDSSLLPSSQYKIVIVKLSSSGQLLWRKTYGASNPYADAPRIIEAAGGGFLCIGNNHLSTNIGNHFGMEMWLFKIDGNGNMLWNELYGDYGDEKGYDIITTNDGNYIISGAYDIQWGSDAGIAWVLKISPTGAIIWQTHFMGLGYNSDFPVVDTAAGGGYFVSFSASNVSLPNYHGNRDIVVSKLSGGGSILWSKCFGGPNNDRQGENQFTAAKGLLSTPDGGCIITAQTNSASGDVTTLYPNSFNVWIAKIDPSGNLSWQKTLGGTSDDCGMSIYNDHNPGNYILTATSRSKDGDVYMNKGQENGWVIRLGPGNAIKGTIYKDLNSNGVKDAGEALITGATITHYKGGTSQSAVSVNGNFASVVDTGQYLSTVNFYPYYTVNPVSVTTPYHGTPFNTDSISFGMQPIAGMQDLVVNAFPLGVARPGFDVDYKIVANNIGTDNVTSGSVKFVLDPKFTLLSSVPATSTTVGDTLIWNYANFNTGDTLSYLLHLKVKAPPVANNGDTVKSLTIVLPIVADQTPSDDTMLVKQVLTGSFDPNDKSESHAGKVTSSFITSGDNLLYTIRFQNTGTDTAFKVVVRDTLDSKLDWSTLRTISASHTYSLTIIEGQYVTWTFDKINLVDSNHNEPLSHGHIVYAVQPRLNVAPGEIIHNTASIYFDYNLPITTNDATTIVQDANTILPVTLLQFAGGLVNDKVILNWRVTGATNFDRFEIERSIDSRNYSRIGTQSYNGSTDYKFPDNISGLQSRIIYYRLKMIDSDGEYSFSKVLAIRLELNEGQLIVYPNPAVESTFISFTSFYDGVVSIQLFDQSGKLVLGSNEFVQKGKNVIPVSGIKKLARGNYIIKLTQNDRQVSTKLTVN